MNQKESVYSATIAVAQEDGISFNNALEIQKTSKDKIVDLVTESIISGDTEFSADARAKHVDTAAIRKYVVGLVNNWFRKDTRLNGGSKYVAKNPGSRQGIADPQIKELKKLLDLHPEAATDINAAINARQAEINATKVQITVNLDLIPASLRGLVVKAAVTEEVDQDPETMFEAMTDQL
jgi:hypothetical protein